MSIIVCRPDKKGQDLVAIFQQENILATHLPTLNILPLNFSVKNIDKFDVFVFTSQYAVKYFFKKHQNNLLHKKIYAIGNTTAKELAKNNLKATFNQDSQNSEGLWEIISTQSTNKKIAIISGVGGRDFLQYKLLENNIYHKKIEVYKRDKKPQNIIFQEFKNIINMSEVNFIITTSYDVLKPIGNILKKFHNQLQYTKITVVNQKMVKYLGDIGFNQQNIVYLAKYDNKYILKIIKKIGL